MITLIIADDHALVRSGFAMMLNGSSEFEVVDEAADGRQAVEVVRQQRPDVVLMDLQMPGMDGIEATRHICEDPTLNGVRIIMVTTFDDDVNLLAALGAGASGFLGKDVEPTDLMNAIRTIATGSGTLVLPAQTRHLIEASLQTRNPVDSARTTPRFAQLTARELEVVTQVAHGLNNAEIGEALYISAATVKTHLARSMTKLGVRDRVHVVIAAYEHGLVGPR